MYRSFVLAAIAVLASLCSNAQAMPDTTYNITVAKPLFSKHHPRLLFDEAHRNYHRANGTYRPFAELARNEGLQTTINRDSFTAAALNGFDVLVIANAKGQSGAAEGPAFSEAECIAVRRWVEKGGSLLLITDHYPFGAAAKLLAAQFGVHFQEGMVVDTAHYDRSSGDESQIVFTKANGGLATNVFTEGVDSVLSFTGQSITRSHKHIPLLQLAPTAQDLSPEIQKEQVGENTRTRISYVRPESAAGRCQALAFDFGRGRVLVTGEAAMLSAQFNRRGGTMGMNYPGAGNRLMVRNMLRWLGH